MKKPFPWGHREANELRGISLLLAEQASILDQNPDGEADQVVAKAVAYQVKNLAEMVYDLLQSPER